MTNKKENKNAQDLPTTDAGGFTIRDGEVSSTTNGDTTVHFTSDAPTVTADEADVTSTKNVDAEQPKEKSNKKASEADVEFERLVEETIRGAHGSGRERMIALGSNYAKVQQEVNRRLFK